MSLPNPNTLQFFCRACGQELTPQSATEAEVRAETCESCQRAEAEAHQRAWEATGAVYPWRC